MTATETEMSLCLYCNREWIDRSWDCCDSCFEVLTGEYLADMESRDQFVVWLEDELESECDESCSICFPHFTLDGVELLAPPPGFSVGGCESALMSWKQRNADIF